MATEIRSLLEEGAAKLARVSDQPRREAEVLLGAALGRSRAWLLANPDERILDCEATDRYEAFLTRRAQGEPVAYLLGEREFWSLPLRVGPGVLVPRPESELVVERALEHLPTDRDLDLLDLASGSGAIALALASERPRCRVYATDVAAAKKFYEDNGVAYDEFNVKADAAAAAKAEELAQGKKIVPVIVEQGEVKLGFGGS